VHATAVTASQSIARSSAQRAYNGQLLQLLRALPSGLLQHGARWSVVMNIYAQAALTVRSK